MLNNSSYKLTLTLTPIYIFILFTLLTPSSAWYTFKSSYSFYGYSITSFTLAPKTVNAISANINLAMGLYNGTVVFTNTDDFNTKYNAYPFNGNAILKMDWTEAGVFLQTANQIKVIDPINYSTKLNLNFTDSIVASCTASALSGSKILTAVSLPGRILIYENTLMVMNRSIQNPSLAITFDKTGNYFYYFDSFTRYVVDVKQRTIFNSKYLEKNQICIAASTKSGYEDVTATIQFGGKVQIWDDYDNIGTYSPSYPQNFVTFTGDSEYLVTYQNVDSKITLWKTNFGSFNTWTISQSFSQNSGGSTVYIDAKNDRIVTMSLGVFFVYANQGDSSPTGVILAIVFSVIGFIVLVGVIAFCCRRRAMKKNRQKDNYEKIHDQGFNPNPVPNSNQGFNNGGQGWSNNPNNQGWGNQGGWPGNTTNTNNQGWSTQGQGWSTNKTNNSNPYGAN